MGHGAAACLMTGVAKGVLDLCSRLMKPAPMRPSSLLKALNLGVVDAGAGHQFMTASVAVVDIVSGQMQLASAAHPLPYVVSNRRCYLDQVPVYGPRLGESVDASFPEIAYQLHPGDLVMWHTDGLPEAENETREQFGHRKIRRFLRQEAGTPVGLLSDILRDRLNAFENNRGPNDDRTWLLARFCAQSAPLAR